MTHINSKPPSRVEFRPEALGHMPKYALSEFDELLLRVLAVETRILVLFFPGRNRIGVVDICKKDVAVAEWREGGTTILSHSNFVFADVYKLSQQDPN